MPVGDFLLGAVVLVVLWGPAAFAGVVVARRCATSGIVRVVGGGLVPAVLVLAATVVPAIFGVLGRGTACVASLLIAAAVVVAARRRPPRRPAYESPAPAPAGKDRPAGFVALDRVAVAAVADLELLFDRTNDPILAIDTVTFHLPNVARWLESGSLWQIDQFIQGQAQGNSPHSGDFLLLSVVMPWHADFAVRGLATAVLVFAALCVVALARELGAARPPGAVAGAAAATLPVVFTATIDAGFMDALTYGGIAAGALFLLRATRSRRPLDLVLAGLALGLAAGTKWYGLPAAGVVLLAGAGYALRRLPVRAVAAGVATT